MFSVDDLLLSHGYKLSETAPSSSENKCKQFQQEVPETRLGHKELNGYERDSGTCVQSKKLLTEGDFSAHEVSHGCEQRQRGHKGLGTSQASDGRFPSAAPVEWPSCHKSEKDIAYWRRRGQDFSILLGYTDKGHSESKGGNTAKPEDMAESNAVFQSAKEGRTDTRSERENPVRRNVLDETWKPSVDYQWSSLSTKCTENANKLSRQMSDGDGEKLLQDFYSFNLRDDTLNSQRKGKSLSLPRVLSPQRYVNMPIPPNNNHLVSGDKLQSYPKNSKAGRDFYSLMKPKYGRPLKPPSYELHQQAWGTVEGGGFQENPQKDEYVSIFTKDNEPRQDFHIQDSSLEPPVYVPPPSYKSPPQKNMNPHSLNEVPHYKVCFSDVQSCLEEGTNVNQKTSSSILKADKDFCTDYHFPCKKPGHHQFIGDYIHSVQYIPFDDPRIRHIKLEQNEGHQDNLKQRENVITTSPTVGQDKNIKGIQNNCAFLEPPNLLNAAQCRNIVSESAIGNRWLTVSSTDHECITLSDQIDSSAINARMADCETSRKETNGKVPLKKTQSDSAYEIITKVKKFEPATGAQSKCNSKRKMNETIFCLVSIPVKSESDASDTDKSNDNLSGDMDKTNWLNDSKSGSHGQNLLRTSSTDLELQALTGSMPNKNGLPNQELHKQVDFKQRTDLRLVQPAKHKELTYSGSWPGDQYRDQQTQTNFRGRLKGSEFIHDSKLTIPNNKRIGANCLGSTITALKEQGLPSGNCEKSMYDIKRQTCFSPSSNSAFMRTPSLVNQLPKAQQSQNYGSSYGSVREKEQSPISKGEVLKGDVSTPSDNKELFGQFLLKPVSRRPWDAISELENLNKEFQGQEESDVNGDAMENEEKEQEDCVFIAMPSMPTKRGSTNRMVNCNKQKAEVPQAPVFKQEKVKSNSESWSIQHESDILELCDDQQNSSQEEDPSSKWVWPTEGRAPAETIPEITSRINNQTVAIASPSQRMLSSGPSGANLNKMPSNFNCREGRFNVDDSLLDLSRLSKANVPRTDPYEQIDPITYLPVKKNQGLPEQERNYLGFSISHQLSGNKSIEFCETQNAPEIPENESVQARATRILGIEVGMDFLLSHSARNGENHHPKHAWDLELPTTGRLSAMVERDVQRQENSSFSNEKQDLKESFLTEDLNFLSKKTAKSKCQNTDKNARDYLATERELGLEEQHSNLFCKSVLNNLEETRLVPSSEKRTRGTSKKIETLQGKLASIPSRTAMDRLVRMKEVDSVSRMRRLSCKSTDSGDDEGDEEKQHQVLDEKGHKLTIIGSDASCKLTHTGAVSKQIISLNESTHLVPNDKKRPEEMYDPARVERV